MLPGRFEAKLAAVARAGIQSVELLDAEHTRWTEAEADHARRLLRAYNLTVDTIAAAADWQSTVALARKLEAPMVLVTPASGTRMGDLAVRAGLTVLHRSLDVVKQLDHPSVRLLFDTGSFESAAPYVKVIHAPEVPSEDFYKAVVKSGFEGHIAMAYTPAGDLAASLMRAVDGMRRSLAAKP